MTNEKYAPIIGTILLALGIVILLFVLSQALALVQGAGDYFSEQFPEEDETDGPSAMFSWSTDDLTVQFSDESETGEAAISSWEWDFADGETSQDQNPEHIYDSSDDYRVRLRVEDMNGKKSTAYGNVYVENGNQDGGSSEPEGSDLSFEFGNFLLPLAAALLIGILYLVMFLVGAALTKAGWNLIKPGPSTLKMKIKPKRLEVESIEPTAVSPPVQAPASTSVRQATAYYQQTPPVGPAPAVPMPMYYPQQPTTPERAVVQPTPISQPVEKPTTEQASSTSEEEVQKEEREEKRAEKTKTKKKKTQEKRKETKIGKGKGKSRGKTKRDKD